MNIKSQYEDMLKLADAISDADKPVEEEMDTILTDDQVNELRHTLDGCRSDDDNMLQSIMNTKSPKTDEADSVMEQTIINPSTGLPMMSQEIGSVGNLKFGDANIDELMDLDKIEKTDLTKIEITEDAVKKTVTEEFPGNNFDAADITALLSLAKDYSQNKTFRYYSSMPASIQNAINSALGTYAPYMGKYSKEGRNYIAKQLLDTIVQSNAVASNVNDFTTAVYNSVKDIGDATKQGMSDFFTLQMTYFEESIPAQIKKYEDAISLGEVKQEDAATVQNKIDTLYGVSEMFKQSYSYDDMMDVYKSGKIKVKPIQIEKFKRTCQDDFNFKFQKSENVINDVRLVLTVLDRKVDKKYDIDDIKKFICIFINYTKKMSADSIIDYTFMYNFIKNILNLDYHAHDNEMEEAFYSNLLTRINSILSQIHDEHKEAM